MYSVGIDIGTTSCKLCVLSSNETSNVLFDEQRTHDAHLSRDDFPSFDEQCPSKILFTIESLMTQSNLFNDPTKIRSIQVCSQMHGLLFWSSRVPRTQFSSLITWQDQRCTNQFLSSLAPSLAHLHTGYGLATLLWLRKDQQHFHKEFHQYDRIGTIADYLVAVLIDDCVTESLISTQMATSWGSVNNQWPVEDDLLPRIVEPGTIVGFWKKKSPVFVGLGDLQCSVFSCQPVNNQAFVNISTSAQLVMTIDRDQVLRSTKISSNNDPTVDQNKVSYMQIPYFSSKDLIVAASLNGGNVLSAFVHLVHQWMISINPPSTVLSIDSLWTRLIELGLEASSVDQHYFSAALFGERHDPNMSAFITNLKIFNLTQFNNVGTIFRSICRWIIENLFRMLGEHSKSIQSIVACGSALVRNTVLQEELRRSIDDKLVMNQKCDAAYGAALFASKQSIL